MAKDKARVAVIGTGWWSTFTHIPGLLANPNAELVAICDRSEERLQKAITTFSVKGYRDYQELLSAESLDGAVVAVTHNAHYEVAKACLEAGLHVMVEKPMVLKAAHARELVDLAAQKGLQVIAGYPFHYTETTRRAREIMQSGQLGPIQFVSCLFASMAIEFYRGNDEAYRPVFNYPVIGPGQAYSKPHVSGGGQGHLQVTHLAGSLFLVTDLQADRVSCYMDNWDVPVDLVDALAVRFKPNDGHAAVGVFGSTGNKAVGDSDHLEIRIYCENGYLILEQVQSTLYVRRHDGTESRFGPLPPDDRYPRFATANNLVDCILGRGKNQSPGSVGARVVELLEAAYLSASETGRPIAVEDLYRE
jgi:predicted dehydrogenase